jgi:cellulose synthase/poly-beta-1,6-N-acetylglucosamine synthase-like glycosyltransferase
MGQQEQMMEWLFIIPALFYLFFGIVTHFGLRRVYPKSANQPKVSVLIAARNEEENLPACLESLARQDYPSEQCEIVILNDRSADKTAAIAESYCSRFSHFRLIDVADDIENLKGKMNVLAQGIRQTTGELILVTDADCELPVSWISHTVSCFTDKIGMTAGMTILNGSTIRERVLSLDWLYLVGIAAGSAGSGFPVTVLGNNFAFRRKTYDEVGGFEKIGFSLTEDFALLRAMRRHTGWKIAYPVENETTIASQPPENWAEFYRQRKRWIRGGLKAPLYGYTLMTTTFLSRLFLLFSIHFTGWHVPVAITTILLSTDFMLATHLSRKIGKKYPLPVFLFHQIYYFIYLFAFAPVLLFPGKINWKGRSFN